MKTVVLSQAPKAQNDAGQEQKGRDVGKSAVAAGCHGFFAMQLV